MISLLTQNYAVVDCTRHAKAAISEFITTLIAMNVPDFETSFYSSPISTRIGIQGGKGLWSCGTPTKNNACAN